MALTKKQQQRKNMQENQRKLREEKRLKREEERKNKPYVSPRERKFGKKPEVTKTKTKSGKPKTKAQMMATKNIQKFGGTAKAAAANKEAMRLRIKKKYQESKKKKK
tara:strand:- start:869 stop:1189 length:321 start_codon:yes stop_codon:yes gene_type:complete